MAYTTREAITASIPPQFLVEALDDDGDGLEDAGLFDEVMAAACGDVDAYLAQRFTVPLTEPAPAIVKTAAEVFTLEKLYLRRGYAGERNPWTERADELRRRLQAIGDGEAALEVTLGPAKPSAVLIGEKSRLYDARRVPALNS